MKSRERQSVLFPLIAWLIVFANGCAKSDGRAASAPGIGKGARAAGDHSGWWCPEHGVPEEECSVCSTQTAADFQKRGDWCKQHKRAESQCFVCSPDRFEKFAARYEAKLGKRPPTPEANWRSK